MKILITGITGRVGANVAQKFIESGHEVRGFVWPGDRQTEKMKAVGAEIVEGDLATSVDVNAAAEDLTIPCIHLEKGADVVAYSGGKAICGPQGAGLLLGDKKILMSAWQASSSHHGPNRDNKIGREEIMGMLAAVEAWVTRDHAAEWQTWLSRLHHIAQRALVADAADNLAVAGADDEDLTISQLSAMLAEFQPPAAVMTTGQFFSFQNQLCVR